MEWEEMNSYAFPNSISVKLNGQLFPYTQIFPRFLYFLNIHHRFNITNIIPPSSDDGSLEPKRYSVDFVSQ